MKAAVVGLACILRFAVSAQAADFVHPSLVGGLPLGAASASAAEPSAAAGDAKTADSRPSPQGKDAENGAAAHDERRAAPIRIKVDPKQPAREAAKPRQEANRRDAGRPRVCFNAAETRENITAHRLSEPFRALRAGRQQGEALRAKLCKWKQDEFVYEIFVLRRDGRIVRVYMNAQSGQALGALDENDRH